MASVSTPEDDPDAVAAGKWGTIAGGVFAVGASVVAPIALTEQSTDFTVALAWVMFTGPLAVGLVLSCIPRTRRFGAGLFLGVFFTLIVCGGPLTCASSLMYA